MIIRTHSINRIKQLLLNYSPNAIIEYSIINSSFQKNFYFIYFHFLITEYNFKIIFFHYVFLSVLFFFNLKT